MPEPHSLDTFRAAAGTVLPATDDLPGAVEAGADRHAVELIELALPGFVDLITALLDAYAADVVAGARFVDLDDAGRGAVFRAMSSDESQDVRDAIDAVFVFCLGGTYSEWSVYDRTARALRSAPPMWSVVGYDGPVVAHPDYRDGM
jgi:hypothetical protein